MSASTPLIVIRPEPGCRRTVAAAIHRGLSVLGFPMFEVTATPWCPPAVSSVDALLIGSANALRHGGAGLGDFHSKPAYVVGRTTAGIAEAAGLTIAAVGTGGLGMMLSHLAPEHRRLLRLTGADRVDLVPPDGVTIDEHVVYVSQRRPMPGDLASLLKAHALDRVVVMLHSGLAADHFVGEGRRLAIDPSRITLAALAPRIASAARRGWPQAQWADVAVAAAPDDAALLALAEDLCKKRPGRGE
jgi:uroporphyrinogen-III synthase